MHKESLFHAFNLVSGATHNLSEITLNTHACINELIFSFRTTEFPMGTSDGNFTEAENDSFSEIINANSTPDVWVFSKNKPPTIVRPETREAS